MKGQSDSIPDRIVIGKCKSHFNYNIEEVVIEDEEGNPKTIYKYDYVEIEGNLTKAKIEKALSDTKLDIVEEIVPEAIEAQYNGSKEAIKLSKLSNLSFEQFDTYITNNVTDLPSAKTYIKELSKVVLAMLKILDLK